MENTITIKNGNGIIIYQKSNNPNIVYKKYFVDSWGSIANSEYLQSLHEKFIQMTKDPHIPNYIVKPIEITEIKNDYEFQITQPFISGKTLKELFSSDATIEKLEEVRQKLIPFLSNPKFIITDPNAGNFIIDETNGELKYIDIESTQFNNFTSASISTFCKPIDEKSENTRGFKKCCDTIQKGGNIYNQQFNIRNSYLILFNLLGNRYVPPSKEQNISYYEQKLKEIGLPESSELHRKFLLLPDETKPNEQIDNSLYDLIQQGYKIEKANNYSYSRKLKFVKK